MKALKDFLRKKNVFSRRAIDDRTVFFVFNKIVREEFGTRGRENFIPDYFSRKKLFVKCGHPLWAAELALRRKELIEKLNAELGPGVLEEIKTKS